MAMRKASCYCSVLEYFWKYPLINSNLRLKLPWILIWQNQPAMLDSSRTWCLWRPPCLTPLLSAPTPPRTLPVRQKNWQRKCASRGHIFRKKNATWSSKIHGWLNHTCMVLKISGQIGSTKTKYNLRDGQNPSPTTHNAQGQWWLMIPPGKKNISLVLVRIPYFGYFGPNTTRLSFLGAPQLYMMMILKCSKSSLDLKCLYITLHTTNVHCY